MPKYNVKSLSLVEYFCSVGDKARETHAIGFSTPLHICAKHAPNALSSASQVNTTGNLSENMLTKEVKLNNVLHH